MGYNQNKFFLKMLPFKYWKHFGIIVIMTFLLSNVQAYSQDTTKTDTLKKKRTYYIPPMDSLKFHNMNEITKDQKIPDKKYEMTKSPTGALWRSFVLPGWGQLYVESYWKAPVFFLGAGTLAYFSFWNNSRYQNDQQIYDNTKQIDPTNKSKLDSLDRYKEYYRNNRDQCIFYIGLTYILAAVDAYVGAHLYDFDVSEKLSMRIEPYYNNSRYNAYGVSFNLRIK